MKYIINNVVLRLDENETILPKKIADASGLDSSQFEWSVLKKSIDARRSNVLFVYTILIDTSVFIRRRNVVFYSEPLPVVIPVSQLKDRPVVAGFGPAGIFAALTLARAGARPIVLERGRCVEDRERDISKLQNKGIFDPHSNYCFGEGGAGTFSDGKLNTGVHDDWIRYCLEEFVKHGAKSDILSDSMPHIGSDYLKIVVKNFRNEIISLGGEVLFESTLLDIQNRFGKLTGIVYSDANGIHAIKTSNLILALGHSARDTLRTLKGKIHMEPKDFSMGVRIEHIQKDIDKAQYHADWNSRTLPPATYKCVIHLPNGRVVYSFCMCPGGYVVNSSSEENAIVTNGMSNNARDGINGNSALLVNVKVEDFYQGDPLDGFLFQEQLEKRAFKPSLPYHAPAEMVSDFLNGCEPMCFGHIKPTYRPGVYFGDLNSMLPDFISQSLKEGFPILISQQVFFSDGQAVLTGFETRSSSPVRIQRGDDCCSNVRGVYPTGEGASYAGGIMSSGLDGLKVALTLLRNRY